MGKLLIFSLVVAVVFIAVDGQNGNGGNDQWIDDMEQQWNSGPGSSGVSHHTSADTEDVDDAHEVANAQHPSSHGELSYHSGSSAHLRSSSGSGGVDSRLRMGQPRTGHREQRARVTMVNRRAGSEESSTEAPWPPRRPVPRSAPAMEVPNQPPPPTEPAGPTYVGTVLNFYGRNGNIGIPRPPRNWL